MKKKLLILAVTVIILVASFIYLPDHEQFDPTGKVQIGDTFVKVEIADTPSERIQGLSGRDGLKDDQGMLFIFDEPLKAGFWMKDMKFAIDIIWIDENKKIIGIEKSVEPETYPTTFYSPSEVKYVLEVPAGFVEREGLKVGEILFIGQENL